MGHAERARLQIDAEIGRWNGGWTHGTQTAPLPHNGKGKSQVWASGIHEEPSYTPIDFRRIQAERWRSEPSEEASFEVDLSDLEDPAADPTPVSSPRARRRARQATSQLDAREPTTKFRREPRDPFSEPTRVTGAVLLAERRRASVEPSQEVAEELSSTELDLLLETAVDLPRAVEPRR